MLDNSPIHPKAPQSYLDVISENTNTYCVLNEVQRTIEITARNAHDLEEAYSRFDVIQTNFVGALFFFFFFYSGRLVLIHFIVYRYQDIESIAFIAFIIHSTLILISWRFVT
jgi:hypothetical protein